MIILRYLTIRYSQAFEDTDALVIEFNGLTCKNKASDIIVAFFSELCRGNTMVPYTKLA